MLEGQKKNNSCDWYLGTPTGASAPGLATDGLATALNGPPVAPAKGGVCYHPAGNETALTAQCLMLWHH